MDADYTYRFIQSLARKNQVSQITPQEYTFYVSSAQNKVYDYLIGLLQGYKPLKPVPNVAIGMSAKVDIFLLPLKITDAPVVVVANTATYPIDLDYLVSMTDSAGKTISILDDSKFNSRYNSDLDPITDADTPPFGKRTTLSWKIYPSAVTSILVTYYKRPPKTVWGYTTNGQGRAVYDPATSVAPVFQDIAMELVIALACKGLGFSFNAEDLLEYGKEVQAIGG